MEALSHTPINLHHYTHDYQGLSQELLISLPNSDQPTPGVIILHPSHMNAYTSLRDGFFLTQQGFATCMPSLLGYGNSEGTPDYGGPHTIAAILQAIELFKQHPNVDANHLSIWGTSLGAKVASQIILHHTFQAAILQSGAYDLINWYQSDPKALKRNMTRFNRELGTTNTEDLRPLLEARSITQRLDTINTPILLLHGDQDHLIPVSQAIQLDQKLTQANKPHQLHIIPGGSHFIGSKVKHDVLTYLNQHLTL